MSVLAVLVGLAVGYVATVHADYLIHRNIWHGRWAVVRMWPFRWLLFPHYVHHWKAHHRHAARSGRALTAGEPVPPAAHAAVEAKYADQWNVHYGLRCTSHGITISGPECVAHYLAVFFFTPQPYIAALLYVLVGPPAGIAAALMPLCAVCSQIGHRYYHMSEEARARIAPWYLRRLLLTREFSRMATEHLHHHFEPAAADEYYGVLPFGHLLPRGLYRSDPAPPPSVVGAPPPSPP